MSVCTESEIIRLLAKHGLPTATPERGPYEGVVNEVWLAGDVVVRVNKNLNYESDVWTETVAVPALIEGGINTPQLLVFDHDFDIVDRLITIYERAPGIPLSKVTNLENPAQFFFDLGQCIRSFHDRVKEVEDPKILLDQAWSIEEEVSISWFGGLAPEFIRRSEETEPTVFCHQDLHPDNILVHEGKLSTVIDWGDAGWAGASVDLRYIPARFLPKALEGYGEISSEMIRRIVILQIDQLKYAEQNSRSYGLFGDSTREEIETFMNSALRAIENLG